MRAGLFWLIDRQWACIAPHLPMNLTGPERDDDRRIISGIIDILQCGARWRDCPPEYGPYTTIYNRFNRCLSALELSGGSLAFTQHRGELTAFGLAVPHDKVHSSRPPCRSPRR